MVGEQGPEIVDLAPGSMVHSNPDSQRMMAGGGGWGGGPVEARVSFDGTGDALIDAFLSRVRVRIQRGYGGDVQAALGYRR